MIDLDIDVRTLNGEKVINLKDEYTGKVILVVNTASKCGYTGQYEGLEEMYATYKDEGLVVLGFPSNDFYQEQGSEKEIQDFCRLTYGVKFPMFKKTSVRKPSADVLYQRLGDAAGEYPKWNFHKYLIDREGHLVGSYRSSVKAETGQLFKTIQSLL
ncbi:MAG: glutathione peroxidase [bacterium]